MANPDPSRPSPGETPPPDSPDSDSSGSGSPDSGAPSSDRPAADEGSGDPPCPSAEESAVREPDPGDGPDAAHERSHELSEEQRVAAGRDLPIQWGHPVYRSIFLVALVIGFVTLGVVLKDIINPVLVAALAAYILNPIVERLEARGVSRRSSVTGLFLVAGLLVTTGLGVFGLKIFQNVTEIRIALLGEEIAARRGQAVKTGPASSPAGQGDSEPTIEEHPAFRPGKGPEQPGFLDLNGNGERDPGLVERAGKRLEPLLSRLGEEDFKRMQETLKASAGRVAEGLVGLVGSAREFLSSLTNLVSYLVLGPIYTFFFLLSFSDMRRELARHLPAAPRAEILDVAAEIDRSVAAFFRGRLIIALIKGAVTGVLLQLFDVPFGFVIGLTAGLLSFVPVVGPLIGATAAIILGSAEASSMVTLLIGITAIFTIAELVEAGCYPLVLGKEVGLHPVLLILAFLTFGKLLGLFGVLLAVPIASIVKILFRRYVLPEIRELAGLPPPETEASDGEAAGATA